VTGQSNFSTFLNLDRHGRIISQKHSEDRKMEDRKMFAPLCGAPSHHRQLLWHDIKRHLSVFHFSVLVFCSSQLNIVKL